MADLKITQLTEDTSPTYDDLIATVHDPGGSPANRKVTFANSVKALGWVNVRSYASINAAVAAIGATQTTLVVPNAQTLTASLTIPSTLKLVILNGGSIVKASTYTLTINGPPEIGLYQVFSGFSAGDVTGLKEAYPEWFYSGAGSYTTAIQSASAAVTASPNIVWFFGDYNIDASIVPVSNRSYLAKGKPSITITTANDVFAAEGTKTSHLSNIIFKGIKFIGQEATVTKYAVDIRWVDNLRVEKCETVNLKLASIMELDADTYAGITLAQTQNGVFVINNRVTMTVSESGLPIVMLRYVRNFSVIGNIVIGHTTSLGGGLYIFGGGCNPAGDGAWANLSGGIGRKAADGVINNNVVRHQASGINVAQAEGIVVEGNTLDDCGESIWVGASKGVTAAKNVIVKSAGFALQTQGINENILFDGNNIHLPILGGAFLIGPTWTSEYNIGPICFINNTVKSDVANTSSFYDIGHLIIKNNTFYNVQPQIYGKVAQLEIEGNSFIYDLFVAATSLLRLSQYNATMTGLPGITDSYTKIKNNTWYDRTGVGNIAVIYIYDPITTSTLYIEGNTLKVGPNMTNLMLATSSAVVTLTTFISNNKFVSRVYLKWNNTATNSHVYWKDNYKLNGQDYHGAAPAEGLEEDYFSIGSRVWSNNPTGDAKSMWLCTAEGAPGTWVGAVFP